MRTTRHPDRHTPRGIRANRTKGTRFGPLPGRGGPARFAAAILGRYGFFLRGVPGVDLAFLQRLPGVTVQQIWQTAHVHLEPRLALTLLAWPARSLEAPASRPVHREEATLAYQEPSANGEVRYVAQTIQRLFARSERIEVTERSSLLLGTTLQRFDSPPPAPIQLTFPSAPRIFHVPPRPDPVDEAALPTVVSGPSTPRGRLSSASFVSQSSMPMRASELLDLQPGEINRLTDRVIEAIDRRITAQRERLGRP